MQYEFRKGRFPRGWRGDGRCKTCDFRYFSREAIRMEMFGLIKIINPPQKHEKNRGTADSSMFKITNLKVNSWL